MTLKEIADGIKKAIEENKGLTIDGIEVIKKIGNQLYFSLEFLKVYGSIIRLILRDRILHKK